MDSKFLIIVDDNIIPVENILYWHAKDRVPYYVAFYIKERDRYKYDSQYFTTREEMNDWLNQEVNPKFDLYMNRKYNIPDNNILQELNEIKESIKYLPQLSLEYQKAEKDYHDQETQLL